MFVSESYYFLQNNTIRHLLADRSRHGSFNSKITTRRNSLSFITDEVAAVVRNPVETEDTLSTLIEKVTSQGTMLAGVKDSRSGEYVAIVDLLDLLPYCCALFSDPRSLQEPYLSATREKFKMTKLIELLDLNGRNLWTSIPVNASLLTLLQLLSHPNIERVAVIDPSKEKQDPVAIVTREDVIKYLNRSVQSLRDIIEAKDISYFLSILHENKFTQLQHQEQIQQFFATNQMAHLSYHQILNAFLGRSIGDVVADTFRMIWIKQLNGQAMTHGSNHTDRFLNWVCQILLSELPAEEPYVLTEKDPIRQLLDHVAKDRRVLIANEQRLPLYAITSVHIIQYICMYGLMSAQDMRMDEGVGAISSNIVGNVPPITEVHF